MNTDIKALLQAVQDGTVSVDDALLQLKQQPFEDLGYAKVDLHRKVRQGANEVIYGAGKTPEQIIGILEKMGQNGQENVLITRLDKEKADIITQKVPISYYENAKIAVAGRMAAPGGIGTIVIATGGTSDIPVAEEAALTAEILGNNVKRIYDKFKDEYTIIVTADHGGHDRGHGSDMKEDMTIPQFYIGENFEKGKVLEKVSILDTAPTVADVLGLEKPREWEGKSLVNN